MRHRPFASWLAIMFVAVLSLISALASADNAPSTAPKTQPAVTRLAPDNYTITVDAATVAPKFDLTLKAQGTTGTVSPWSGAFFYDVRSHTLDAVVLNKVLDLTKNTKLSGFSLYGFAGSTVDKNGKAVAGLAIGKDWKWFDQVSFFTGIGVSFSASTPVGGGFIVGASVKF